MMPSAMPVGWFATISAAPWAGRFDSPGSRRRGPASCRASAMISSTGRSRRVVGQRHGPLRSRAAASAPRGRSRPTAVRRTATGRVRRSAGRYGRSWQPALGRGIRATRPMTVMRTRRPPVPEGEEGAAVANRRGGRGRPPSLPCPATAPVCSRSAKAPRASGPAGRRRSGPRSRRRWTSARSSAGSPGRGGSASRPAAGRRRRRRGESPPDGWRARRRRRGSGSGSASRSPDARSARRATAAARSGRRWATWSENHLSITSRSSPPPAVEVRRASPSRRCPTSRRQASAPSCFGHVVGAGELARGRGPAVEPGDERQRRPAAAPGSPRPWRRACRGRAPSSPRRARAGGREVAAATARVSVSAGVVDRRRGPASCRRRAASGPCRPRDGRRSASARNAGSSASSRTMRSSASR